MGDGYTYHVLYKGTEPLEAISYVYLGKFQGEDADAAILKAAEFGMPAEGIYVAVAERFWNTQFVRTVTETRILTEKIEEVVREAPPETPRTVSEALSEVSPSV